MSAGLCRDRRVSMWAALAAAVGASVSGGRAAGESPPPEGKITPPVFAGDRAEKMLPAAIADTAIGGAGRYLFLHLPAQRKLAVFDVSRAEVVHNIALDEDRIHFTAGLDKLYICYPRTGLMQRWSVPGFEKELTTTVPVSGEVKQLAMGPASRSPLVLLTLEKHPNWTSVTLNPATHKAAAIPWRRWGRTSWGPEEIRVSADGSTLVARGGGFGGVGIMAVSDGKLTDRTGEYHGKVYSHAIPAPDGRMIFTHESILDADGAPAAANLPKGSRLYPGLEPGFFLAVQGRGGGKYAVNVCADETQTVDMTAEFEDWIGTPEFPFEKRVYLIPSAEVLAVIPRTSDRVMLLRFKPTGWLEKSGIPLLVTSRPVATARKGAAYSYRIAAYAKKGPAKFRLDSGPAGMKVDEAGNLSWAVPADFAEREPSVIVAAADGAGHEIFHTFRITIRD